MKVPISKRLRCCAELIRPGARVADIGADHGYLGIFLLTEGIASHVASADLREKPLARARRNAAAFGVADCMTFFRCDGLRAVPHGSVDTVVCAGMGGDTIAAILADCAWLPQVNPVLILQPQSSGNDLRRWLGENGYRIEREKLVEDSGFLYFVIEARYGGGTPLSPGAQYASPQLLQSGDPLLPRYLARVALALEKTIEGISKAANPDRMRLQYFQTALREVKEMQKYAQS